MAKYDIITIGSATVDAFVETGDKLFKGKNGHVKIPFGSKILVSQLYFETGGGGTNTAVAFARLGFKTAYIGKVGSGNNADKVIQTLKKENVSTEFVSNHKGDTGYSIILDAHERDRVILAYKGSNDHLESKNVDLKKVNTKWLYCCSMMGKSYVTSVKIAKALQKKGVKIAFNPSSYLAKKGKKVLQEMVSITSVIILNKEEARYITKKDSIAEMALSLYSLGPEVVVITDGKNGANAFDGELLLTIKPSKKKIVEATGAGDAFGSGFIAGMVWKKPITKCLQLGLKEAESVIMHPGAKNNLLSKNKIEKVPNQRVTAKKYSNGKWKNERV